MIDPSVEEVISLPEAARRLPKRWGGRRTHASTLYRWATKGLRGRVLETIQIGGSRCTSVEALSRFFKALSTTEGPTVRSAERATADELTQRGL